MTCKKNIIIAAVAAALMTGFTVANANTSNNLLQMDVKRSSAADTVDVTFYTTEDNTNSVVTRKSGNRYVVLLPNVEGSSSVAPGIGGVKDLISDVDVKHVNDGIGGYTKVTFGTVKPINIRTYVKKTAPLTQAQKDYKALIAQNNNTKPAVQTTAQPQKAQTPAPAVNKQPAQQPETKPVSQTKPAQAVNTPKTTPKTETPQKTISLPKISFTPINPPKAKTEPVKPKAVEAPKPQPKKVIQPAPVKPAQTPKAQAPVSDSYVPKMKFDENGKRMIDLEPRIKHDIVKEKTPAPAVEAPIVTENPVAQAESTAVETPQTANSEKKHFPVWTLFAGGAVLLAGAFFLVVDAVAHSNKKSSDRMESFNNLTSRNIARRRRREYQDIIDDESLNWQEKYKKYAQKDAELHPINKGSDMSYVTDMSATKKAIVSPADENVSPEAKKEDIRQKLQAKISQMEHSLAQTPDALEPVEPFVGVRSEDDAISNKITDVKLKSFSKSVSLRQTTRGLLGNDNKQSRNKALKEGRFVKLKNSPLSVNRRNSASSEIQASTLMNAGNKYLNNNGEMNMDKQKENYVLSSLDEYMSILDNENSKKSVVTESLSQIRPISPSMSRSGITNPISRGSNPMEKAGSYLNGLIVKSGYNIDDERGFYLVNMDGVSAIVGRVRDNISIIKKFDRVVNQPLQVRKDYGSVYIVKADGYKCLVDISKDKMGTLIEI